MAGTTRRSLCRLAALGLLVAFLCAVNPTVASRSSSQYRNLDDEALMEDAYLSQTFIDDDQDGGDAAGANEDDDAGLTGDYDKAGLNDDDDFELDDDYLAAQQAAADRTSVDARGIDVGLGSM